MLTALGLAAAAPAPAHADRPLPNVDVRLDAPQPPTARPARASHTTELGAQGVMEIDPATGTPRVVARLDGFLTGRSSRPPADIALSYVRAHLASFGLTRRDLAQLRLTRDYVDILGTHQLLWQQRVAGVPAFDNGLRANVTRDGRLINVLGAPVHGLTARAVRKAFDRRRPRGAEPVLFGTTPAWKVTAKPSPTEHYVSLVDAASGRLLWRANMVHFATGSGRAWEYYPGAPSGGAARPVTFRVWDGARLRGRYGHVYEDRKDRIQVVPREQVPAGAEIPATGGLDWSGHTTTFDTSDAARDCSAAFPCTWDSTRPYSWRRNAAQTAVQVYHYLNRFHDHLYAAPIGFTEAAGNFQASNPPGEGLGRDAVKAQVSDGADTSTVLCDPEGRPTPRGGLPDHGHAINANMEVTQDGVRRSAPEPRNR